MTGNDQARGRQEGNEQAKWQAVQAMSRQRGKWKRWGAGKKRRQAGSGETDQENMRGRRGETDQVGMDNIQKGMGY
jgi:hypothetical protein